jgi:hypothetical protein
MANDAKSGFLVLYNPYYNLAIVKYEGGITACSKCKVECKNFGETFRLSRSDA